MILISTKSITVYLVICSPDIVGKWPLCSGLAASKTHSAHANMLLTLPVLRRDPSKYDTLESLPACGSVCSSVNGILEKVPLPGTPCLLCNPLSQARNTQSTRTRGMRNNRWCTVVMVVVWAQVCSTELACFLGVIWGFLVLTFAAIL